MTFEDCGSPYASCLVPAFHRALDYNVNDRINCLTLFLGFEKMQKYEIFL